jgi:hypothetical protein
MRRPAVGIVHRRRAGLARTRDGRHIAAFAMRSPATPPSHRRRLCLELLPRQQRRPPLLARAREHGRG